MTKKFDEPGCYADGCFGHERVRRRMRELLETIGYSSLSAELKADMSDDASEEDRALKVLNEHCAEGLHFEMVDGDLMLVGEEEEV